MTDALKFEIITALQPSPTLEPMLRYAITARNLLPGDEQQRQAELIRLTAHWAEEGVNFLQIREKDLSAKSLASLSRKIIASTRATRSNIKILLNSRADIAIAVAADGVHLTGSPHELTPTQIRQLYANADLPAPIITLSCHTLEEVARAAAHHAASEKIDAILFGPVFEKVAAGKTISPGTGLATLTAACKAAYPTPILALGGITAQNTQACLEAGAAGIAAIRLFQCNPL
jgi:thiamine-phosphate pyrophosphorylase